MVFSVYSTVVIQRSKSTSLPATPVYVAGVSAFKRAAVASSNACWSMNCSTASLEFLDLLVRLVHAWQTCQFAGAHGGLNRLAKHLPVGIQLGFDGDVVRMNGIQAAHQIVECQHGIAQCGTDIALCGGIGQIALPAGLDERCGQGVKQRAGDLQIRLSVFETDRIDLVRHGRGSGGALDGNLGEHTTGDVHPYIHTQVVQNAVRMADGTVQLGLPVVRFDLRGQRIPSQTHAVGDELTGDGNPIHVRACGQMRAERAGSAIDLAEIFLSLDLVQLAVQTVHVPQAPCPAWSG